MRNNQLSTFTFEVFINDIIEIHVITARYKSQAVECLFELYPDDSFEYKLI